MMSDPVWQLPYQRSHEVAGLAGGLVFVGGAGDFDGVGALRHPGNLEAQLGGALDNVEAALGIEGCGLGDAVRIKLFYAPDSGMNEWEILAAIHDRVGCQPAPAITANPVPMQPFAGQLVQIQAIAQKGWRENADVRVVSEPVPQAHAGLFGVPVLTRGLRAGEFFSVPGRTAAGDDDTVPTDNGTEQTHIVMQGAERELAILTDLFDESQKFTRDEIEHAQPEYWQKRLTRQTNLQLMAGGVQWAQLDSLRQAGLLDELVAERERALSNGHQELTP